MPQDKSSEMPSDIHNQPTMIPPSYTGGESSEKENPFAVQEDTGERPILRNMADVRLRVLQSVEGHRSTQAHRMATSELAENDGRLIPLGIMRKKFAILREPGAEQNPIFKATVAPPRRKPKTDPSDIPDETA